MKTTGEVVRRQATALFLALGLGVLPTHASGQSLTADATPSAQPSAAVPSIGGANTASVPTSILQLLQKQANSPPWNADSPVKTQAILQQCAALQQLITAAATDDTVSNALAVSHLRASLFMAFGESLYNAGDSHHAKIFFASVVQDHPPRATARQLARCHLWLGKLYQDDGLSSKYERRDAAQASVEFQAAAVHFLAAKDASQDWVRGNGWLGAAACYRELGDQEMRRQCLQALLNEQATSSRQNTASQAATNASPDAALGSVQRDTAAYLLATSLYEDKRYAAAAQVYSQILTRVTARLGAASEEYPGQSSYQTLANAGLNWCTARQAEQPAPTASQSTEGQVTP